MGTCRYCGEKTKLLQRKHKDCHKKHLEATATIKSKIISAIEQNCDDYSPVKTEIQRLSETGFLNNNDLQLIYTRCWQKALDAFLDDDLLTEDEEHSLQSYIDSFELNEEDIAQQGYHEKLIKALVLRDLMNGIIPNRMSITGNLPFNLQKTESIIWLYNDVDYYELKTKRSYVGGSSGVSIRIAKGVYYRTSSFKGHPVTSEENVHVANGILLVTNKHLYFGSQAKTFRIRHDKIISTTPHSDGITIQKDGVSAKPQSFVTNDGWFTYNLLSNINNL